MKAEDWEVGGMVPDWRLDQPAATVTDIPLQANQLSVASMLWLTTAIALVLGYAASLGKSALWQAVVYACCVLISGAILGTWRRDWTNAFFWGGLYAMLAYLAVAGGNLPAPAVGFGWGLVGAVVGGVVGIRLPAGLISGSIVAACLGWIAMSVVVVTLGESFTDAIAFDTYTAGIVGGILKPFTVLLQWFEKESRQSRFIMASWLAISVLVGNWLVPILAGVQR